MHLADGGGLLECGDYVGDDGYGAADEEGGGEEVGAGLEDGGLVDGEGVGGVVLAATAAGVFAEVVDALEGLLFFLDFVGVVLDAVKELEDGGVAARQQHCASGFFDLVELVWDLADDAEL